MNEHAFTGSVFNTDDLFRGVRRAFEAWQLRRLLADVSPTLVELDQVLRAKRGCRRG